MRRTYGVDVVLFHEFDIFYNVFYAHYVTRALGRIVMIDSQKFYRYAVELEYVLIYAHVSESDFLSYTFDGFFAFYHFYVKKIQFRLFRVPLFDVKRSIYDRVELRSSLFRLYSICVFYVSLSVKKRIFDLYVIKIALYFSLRLHTVSAIADLRRNNVHIPNVDVFKLRNINVAEYSVRSEHILRLKIRSVTPLIYENNYLVLSLLQNIRNVKLRGIMAAFAVANVLSVDVDLHTRNDAEKSYYPLLVLFLYVYLFPVNAY